MKLSKDIKLLIAADGLSASGKSTGANLISKKYGLSLLSSGLLYRYASYKILSQKNLKNKISFLKKISNKISAKKLKNKKLFLPEVTEYASKIAKSKKVRSILKNYQKKFIKQPRAIIEGRDVATVICPHADIKLFFICSLKTRAKRRLKDFRRLDSKISLKDIEKALKIRDFEDINRSVSPLKKHKDSIVIDSSKLNKKQMVIKISRIIDKKLKIKYGR